jgi:hypothetical protein
MQGSQWKHAPGLKMKSGCRPVMERAHEQLDRIYQHTYQLTMISQQRAMAASALQTSETHVPGHRGDASSRGRSGRFPPVTYHGH